MLKYHKIKKSFPLAWDNFIKFTFPYIKEYNSLTIDANDRIVGNHDVITFKNDFNQRNLYDFFDSHFIYCSVRKSFHYFIIEIENEKGKSFLNPIESMKNRGDSETQLFEAAFKILEDNLLTL